MTQTVKDIHTDSQDAVLARHSAGAIQRYVFPKGTTLFNKGEPRQCAYLIDKGEVHIYGNDDSGENNLLCVLGEGEIFGEMALIDKAPRTATAVTSTDTEIFIIPSSALQERVKGLDPIVSLLISLLIERYRVTRLHMPESVKQEGLGGFIKKTGKYEHLHEDILQLHNAEEARKIARRELSIEQELRQAIEQRQFIPVLQPILSLPERKIVGFETLVRWQHPEKGLLMPNDFIMAAECSGLIRHLDRMMLEKACEIMPVLDEVSNGQADLFISVNMSGVNFGAMDVVQAVKKTLNSSGVNPERIKLEITESALIGDQKLAEEVLQGLKSLGVTIALDDFGTGYSSLGYLHKFSIDDLKIDRSFVAQLHKDNKSIDIVRAIISLAKNFKLGIIAEGIELEEDVTVLNALDCDMGQGFLFSRPLMLDDACKFIRSNLDISG